MKTSEIFKVISACVALLGLSSILQGQTVTVYQGTAPTNGSINLDQYGVSYINQIFLTVNGGGAAPNPYNPKQNPTITYDMSFGDCGYSYTTQIGSGALFIILGNVTRDANGKWTAGVVQYNTDRGQQAIKTNVDLGWGFQNYFATASAGPGFGFSYYPNFQINISF